MLTPVTLTTAERRDLRARSHGLDPVIMISATGLNDAVAAEIDRALTHHELIKIRMLGDDRDARARTLETLCERVAAAPVQHLGKTFTVYRPKLPALVMPPTQIADKAARKATAKTRPKPKAAPKRVLGRAMPKPRRASRRRR